MSGVGRSRRAFLAVIAWRALPASLLLAVATATTPARATSHEDVDPPPERKVKAAFLYQFIPYVEWPAQAFADPDAPIVIGVAGTEAATAELAEVIGARTAKGRPVVVRRLRNGSLAGVHIVFVTRAEVDRLPAIARSAQATGVLVVSESERALELGSMINFRLADGKVRFDVALAPVEKAGLRISSRLLAVAQTVRSAQP